MVYLENTLAFPDGENATPTHLARALDLVQHHSLGEHPVAIEGNRLVLRFFKCRLGSHFTPSENGKTVRAGTTAQLPTGHALPYSTLQALAMTEGALTRLERLSHSVHAVNHFIAAQSSQALELAINPRLATQALTAHDARFFALMAKLGIDPARMIATVAEPLEPVVETLLRDHYQRFGMQFEPSSSVEEPSA